MGIVWENTTPSTELPRDFCAGIGPLQLGVVLVHFYFISKKEGPVYFEHACIRKKSKNANKKRKNENFEKNINKHNAELQRAYPGTQISRGNSVLGVVFSHKMPKMDFHYSHRFS